MGQVPRTSAYYALADATAYEPASCQSRSLRFKLAVAASGFDVAPAGRASDAGRHAQDWLSTNLKSVLPVEAPSQRQTMRPSTRKLRAITGIGSDGCGAWQLAASRQRIEADLCTPVSLLSGLSVPAHSLRTVFYNPMPRIVHVPQGVLRQRIPVLRR